MNRLSTFLTFFLIFNGGSYHFFNRDLNENNHPLGIEFKHGRYSFSCVEYENSFRKTSRTCNAMIEKQWMKYSPELFRIGAVTGYKIKIMPFVLPGYGFEYEGVHAEFFLAPGTIIFLTKFEF